MATSPAADRVHVGSNPTPSSTECALEALRALASLLEGCGLRVPPPPGVRPDPLPDPSACALVDVELFAAIGLLRELAGMAPAIGCAAALLAAREVAAILAARDLPGDAAAWARALAGHLTGTSPRGLAPVR